MSVPGFLLLAAGTSSRFGADKLTAALPSGISVLETTLANLPVKYPLHVVCRPEHDSIITLLQHRNIRYSVNEVAATGMASSISHGVRQTGHWNGWVICLADMPWVQTDTYRTIIEALTADNIVVPVTDLKIPIRRGNPVAFGKAHECALSELSGDLGARALVAANADGVREVNVKDPGILLDIDYPDDINNHANQ